MLVRLQGDISGTRDGQPWPPRGSTIDLPDLEAVELCQTGMAAPVAVDDVETAVVPDDDVETRALTTESVGAVGRRKRA